MFRHYYRKRYKRQNTFAKRMGISQQAVSALLAGKSKPTWRNMIKIAEILNVAPRQLITPHKRHILDKWEDNLIDYLEAPPEIKHEEIIKVGDSEGSSTTTKTVTRELKLTTKEAIELTDKLGMFDDVGSDSDEEPDTDTYDPLKDLVEDN